MTFLHLAENSVSGVGENPEPRRRRKSGSDKLCNRVFQQWEIAVFLEKK